MGTRPIISKSSPWLKRTLFLVSWILSFLILIVFSTNNELNTHYTGLENYEPNFMLIKNQLGAVSYTRCDPKENYRPIYSVCFKNLRVENNNLGIFKTALHKVMKIKDLKLEFCQYSSAKTTTTTSEIYPVCEETIVDIRVPVKEIVYKLITPMDGWRFNNIDISNVSEVCINNFDYKVLYDDELFLAIHSKRATASYKHSGVVLRGHVAIKTADGNTLESNHVNWDLKNHHFRVIGVYVLNRDGVKTTGRDICIDVQLNRTKAQNAKSQQKEGQECFAKL